MVWICWINQRCLEKYLHSLHLSLCEKDGLMNSSRSPSLKKYASPIPKPCSIYTHPPDPANVSCPKEQRSPGEDMIMMDTACGFGSPYLLLLNLFPAMWRKYEVNFSEKKNKKNNTPNSGHATCWYRAYPGSHKRYRTEKPVLPGHTGRNPSASAGSLEKRVVLRNKTSLLWSCRRRGPFPWQWGNWQSLKRTELILLRACRWQWLKQTHQPFFSAPSTGSLNKERSPWEILETPKENHFTRILTLLLNTFKLAYAAVCGVVSPFFVSQLNSYPHTALQEKPSSQFSKALLKRQARYRSLGHLIHPVLGWHSPPRDPIRKEGQTEILTQSSLKQHRHTGIAAMDETPFVFKTWEANISVSLQTQLYFPTL